MDSSTSDPFLGPKITDFGSDLVRGNDWFLTKNWFPKEYLIYFTFPLMRSGNWKFPQIDEIADLDHVSDCEHSWLERHVAGGDLIWTHLICPWQNHRLRIDLGHPLKTSISPIFENSEISAYPLLFVDGARIVQKSSVLIFSSRFSSFKEIHEDWFLNFFHFFDVPKLADFRHIKFRDCQILSEFLLKFKILQNGLETLKK